MSEGQSVSDCAIPLTGPNGTHFNFSTPNATFPNMSSFDFEGAMTENAIKLSYIGAGVFACSFVQVCMVSLYSVCLCVCVHMFVCVCVCVCVRMSVCLCECVQYIPVSSQMFTIFWLYICPSIYRFVKLKGNHFLC